MNSFGNTTLTPQEHVNNLIQFMRTPSGWLMAAALVFLLACLAIWPRQRWLVISFLIYVASLGFVILPWFRTRFIAPLELLRSHGRGISAALLVALLIPLLLSSNGWRRRLLLGGTIVFFAFELLYSCFALAAGLYMRGIGGILIYGFTFLIFGIGVSRWLQDWRDVYKAVECMAWSGVVFSVATIFQLAINPRGIIWQNRLAATGSTATLCAEFIVLALLPTSVLIVHHRTVRAMRIFWSAAAGLLIVFLIWTGTRNGLLMAVIGLSLIFRKRLGQFALLAIATTIFFLVAATLYENSIISAERLLSLQDTRSRVWSVFWNRFLANPIYGDIRNASVVENSYLSVATNLGIIGLIPMGIMIFLVTRNIFRIQKFRHLLEKEAIIADLITGGLAAIAAGAVFDGYLLGMLNAPVFCIYIYLAMMCFIFDYVNAFIRSDAEDSNFNVLIGAY